jgi:hypothetical protein
MSFLFFIAVICFVSGVEHRNGSYNVGSVHRHVLYLSEDIFIWREGCGRSVERMAVRGGVVRVVARGRHERESMSLHSHSLLLLTVWTFPPWA